MTYNPDSLNDVSAVELTIYARQLDKAEDVTFSQIGLICVHVEANKLWAELDFRSFSKWLEDAFPRSRSTAYDAFDVIGKLLPIWPWERIAEARICNLKVAAKLSTAAQNDPEMQEAAAGPSFQFIDKANAKHLQHIPNTKPYNLAPDEAQRATFDALVAIVREMEQDPVASVTQCFHHAAEFCLQVWQEQKRSSTGAKEVVQ